MDLKSYLLEETRDCMVLLDTGANEVVAPFVQSVWDRLSDAHHDQDGSVRKVKLSMAGDRTIPGYLTEWGEVMMNDGDGSTKGEEAWLLPVSRLQEELGMPALYRAGGSAALIWPNGKEVTLRKMAGCSTCDGKTLRCLGTS